MDTLLIAAASFVGFIVAYNTYGRWLGQRIFRLDPDADVPSKTMQDDADYCPTRREVVFGHHFTSIAGTGPIVGPAIAVFWGWLPALIWVLVGSVFIGAVHDFGSLVVSLRNRGQTIGDVAGKMISPRARVLFLVVLFFCLVVVLGIFGLVIAIIFSTYPESVLSVWIEIPLAVAIGWWVYRRKGGLLWPSLAALAVMYFAIWLGTHYPIVMPKFGFPNNIIPWTIVLFVYCFIASVLPVWTLLQPRDYINSHELFLALGLLVVGLAVSAVTGQAQLIESAPAIASAAPADAPPIFPFLFITIACGAVSGFHCLVSSGTSSKQLEKETDARYVGYGSMLLEGALAVIVIMACTAGLGMGRFTRESAEVGTSYRYVAMTDAAGRQLTGRDAWHVSYNPTAPDAWKQFNKLTTKVGAFIEGSGNFLHRIGIPLEVAVGIMAVLVASFAATTIDTATRLQRYVLQELGRTVHVRPLQNKYVATALAVIFGCALSLIKGPGGVPGTGGMILWPLFGVTNQLLAGLALIVVVFYLRRSSRPAWFLYAPLLVMLTIPTWAMIWQLFNPTTGWIKSDSFLSAFGIAILVLQAWMVAEGIIAWRRVGGTEAG